MKIGITGGIGSGKSFVCKLIEKFGFPVFYSDFEAKRILIEDSNVKSEIVQLFGEKAYLNGELNRKFIADQIFTDEAKKQKLNAIIHPNVRANFEKWAESQNSKLVFNEAAILFETGSYKNFDKNILITAPLEVKIYRVMKRDNCSKEEVELRMNNQWNDEQKIKLADYVINNDDVNSLLEQLEQIIEQLNYSTSS